MHSRRHARTCMHVGNMLVAENTCASTRALLHAGRTSGCIWARTKVKHMHSRSHTRAHALTHARTHADPSLCEWGAAGAQLPGLWWGRVALPHPRLLLRLHRLPHACGRRGGKARTRRCAMRASARTVRPGHVCVCVCRAVQADSSP